MAWRIKDMFALFCIALLYLSMTAFGLLVYYVPEGGFWQAGALLLIAFTATFFAFISSEKCGGLLLRVHSRIFLSRVCFYGMFFAIGFFVSATEHFHMMALNDKETYYRYEFLFGSLTIVLSCFWLIWLWALLVYKVQENIRRFIRSLRKWYEETRK